MALFFCSVTHYAQSNDREMALYNVGFASVFSGVGALINKKPDEKWHKVLLKGIAQGAAGGYLIFESKRLIGKIESSVPGNTAGTQSLLIQRGLLLLKMPLPTVTFMMYGTSILALIAWS